MAKKGLGDLLREEAQKSLESEVVGSKERSPELVQTSPDTPNNADQAIASTQTIDVTATVQPLETAELSPISISDQAPADTTANKNKRGSQAKATTKSSDAKATEAKTAKRTPAKAASDRSEDDNMVDTTIAELRKGLAAAQKTEAALQQTIATLQADLAEQKELTQKLQAELKQNKKLQTELEEAKKVILQLTEANAAKPEPAAKPAAKKEPAKPESLQLAKVPQPDNRDYRSHRVLLEERIPRHSIHQHYPSKTTSDADLGWVD